MISKLVVQLKNDKDMPISYQKSSLLHGFIMRNITNEYGDKMHESKLKPFSQHIEKLGDDSVWVINTLNKEAYENIIKPIMNENILSVYFENVNEHIKILSKQLIISNIDSIMEDTIFSLCPRRLTIRFITPTAFKSNGEYIFYPTIKNIFGSLIRKYDDVNETTQIYTPELLIDIEDNIKITRYNLKSTFFSLEGVKIPAFIGEITINISGSQQLVNLVHLLVKFGEYSGVGIKSALGMGCIKIIEREKQDARKTV